MSESGVRERNVGEVQGGEWCSMEDVGEKEKEQARTWVSQVEEKVH